VALQPVTYRPIPAVPAVKRRNEDETERKRTDRVRPKPGRSPDPGTGEKLDTWA
jgi:hypothetical protein